MENARAALNEARDAWHKALDARELKETPATVELEWQTTDELERAIEAYQAFVPDYDPKKHKGYYAYV